MAAGLCASLAIPACSKLGVHGTMLPDQRPTVELSQAPAPAGVPAAYAYEISWAGFDADGRVDHFLYAVDPPRTPGHDTAWVVTHDNRGVFVFPADSAATGGALPLSTRYHVFVVKAVDDRGLDSAPAWRAFDATNVAPSVQILKPAPSALLAEQVAPSLVISWSGIDPDGLGSTQPVRYRWKLFGPSGTFSAQTTLQMPDSVLHYYEPTFAGWDSLPGNATSLTFHDLLPGQAYVFAIVAFDTAGAYTPLLSAASNLLWIQAEPAATLGPVLRICSDAFAYAWPTGGFLSNPSAYAHVDFAADRPIPLSWSAVVTRGSIVQGYRWAVDIASLDDATARSNEQTDLSHWSQWTTETNTLLPAFEPPPGTASQTHWFYLEAQDDAGNLSLGVLQFNAVRATFERDLLVVNDTWLTPDTRSLTGCANKPMGGWPTAAELDTFLFAAGGKPYKCYPAGTQSSPGIFAGYAFDTLGTQVVPQSAVNLTLLDHYRHIVWIVDEATAFNGVNPPGSAALPMPLLRWLVQPGNPNPLNTWLQQGGQLWLMGGGAALASLRDFDLPGTPNNVFGPGELGPGRLMWTFPHWRSQITILRSLSIGRSGRAVGGWPGAPDYSAMPLELDAKTPATDPLPPNRTTNFYLSNFFAEYLTQPNVVVEDTASTLDTLYQTLGGQSGTGFPIMTYYHGAEGPPCIFSGFPIWYFQRAQEIDLLDFVLQRMWGLTRQPVAR